MLPSCPEVHAMTHDYDPDDNFDQAFGRDADIDEDAALEAVAWQLLLLINPGDEDAALQQFATLREAMAEGDELREALRAAIDWKSGFWIEADDAAGLVEVLDELAARFDLRIDWGTDDPSDPDFLVDTEPAGLLGIAFDRLREHHYTLWTWETGDDSHAGWIAHRRDDESVPLVAGALGFHVRPGPG